MKSILISRSDLISSSRIPLYIAVCILMIGLTLLLYPWPIGFMGNHYDHKRLIQVLLLCCLPLFLIASDARQQIKARDFLPLCGVLLFVAGGLVSAVFAENQVQALFLMLHWFLLFILFVITAWVAQQGCFLYVVFAFLVVQFLFVFKSFVFLSIAVVLGDGVTASKIYPSVVNIRFFNQIQVFSIPLLMFVFTFSSVRWSKIFSVFLVLNLFLMFLGGARGLTLSLLLMLSLVFVLLPIARLKIKKILIMIVLTYLLYLLFAWLMALIGSIEVRDIAREGSSGRIELWLEIVKAVSFKRIFIGEGAGQYFFFSQLGNLFSHPHNSVLQIYIEYGFIALLGCISAVYVIFIGGLKMVKSSTDPLLGNKFSEYFGVKESDFRLSLYATFVASIIYSLFSGVIVMPAAQTLFFLFAGAVWGLSQDTKEDAAVNSIEVNSLKVNSAIVSKAKTLLVGGIICTLLSIYFHLAVIYATQQMYRSDFIRAGPSFWRSGDLIGDPH